MLALMNQTDREYFNRLTNVHSQIVESKIVVIRDEEWKERKGWGLPVGTKLQVNRKQGVLFIEE